MDPQKKEEEKICQLCNFYEKKEHSYIGQEYKCEACHQKGCEKSMSHDCWDERVRDGVFLCKICYRCNQNFVDMM